MKNNLLKTLLMACLLYMTVSFAFATTSKCNIPGLGTDDPKPWTLILSFGTDDPKPWV